MRSRRRLIVDEEITVTEVIETQCELCNKKPIVAVFQTANSGIQKSVCCVCATDLRSHSKRKEIDLQKEQNNSKTEKNTRIKQ